MDNKSIILDIAMNLNRVGNWAADGYELRKDKIGLFLDNTTQYIQNLNQPALPSKFKDTFELFLKEYRLLEKTGKKGPVNPDKWAEEMMTWGNILTHRSKFI